MADISTEVYGFVSWIMSFVAYGLFLFWAIVPEKTLQQFGITYYPQKYWALAIPTYVCCFIVFVFIMYNALNLFLTQPLNSCFLITDDFARLPEPKSEYDHPSSVPPVMDIPISVVNQLMFRHAARESPHRMQNPHAFL